MDQQPNSGPESNPPVPPSGTPPPEPVPTPPPVPPASEVPPSSTPPPVTPAPEVPPPPMPSAFGAGYSSQSLPPSMPGESGLVPSKDERMWAMLIHLSGIVGSAFAAAMIPGNLLLPLILWLVKREGAPFINDQGREAVNFQITMTIAAVVSGILIGTVVLACVGIPLLIVIGVFAIVVEIIAAVKSNEGVAYRYPLTFRFIK